MAMRLHGTHAFNGLAWVIASGGLLSAFGPELGRRYIDPQSKEVRVECPGFNNKNNRVRNTPCDQDTLRKKAKFTPSDELFGWFNSDVQLLFRKKRFFDKSGYFIGDGSYIFVPDNENYQGSVRMLFDEHNHPVDSKTIESIDPKKLAKYKWRRCYKLISLIHTDAQNSFYTYAALSVVPGNAHEAPILWKMIGDFVATAGKGIIKHLLLDRGVIDGERISHAKTQYGIDTTIGVKRNMSIFKDAVGISSFTDTDWKQYDPVERKTQSEKRPLLNPEDAVYLRAKEAERRLTLEKKKTAEESEASKPARQWITKVNRTNSFELCSVPLDIVLCTTDKDPMAEDTWAIMTTAEDDSAEEVLQRYAMRTAIEERHRQIKCFWDIAQFTSPDFNMVAHQVVMTLLTYSSLQMHLFKRGKKALNKITKSRLLEKMTAAPTEIVVVVGQYYARFTTYQYTSMVLDVPDEAKPRLRDRLKELEKALFRLTGETAL